MTERIPPSFVGTGFPASVRDAIDSLVSTNWEKLERPGGGWQPYLTPCFPTSWPPGSDQTCRQYAFAYGLSGRHSDAVAVAAPWATITVTPSTLVPRFETTARSLANIGVQGQRRLSPDELDIYATAEVVEKRLLGKQDWLGPQADDSMVARFYQTWLRHNAAVAEKIEPRHPAFFNWVRSEGEE